MGAAQKDASRRAFFCAGGGVGVRGRAKGRRDASAFQGVLSLRRPNQRS